MKNTFQLRGQIWRTVYGQKERYFRDSRGMRYMSEILALNTSECIGVTELVSRAAGWSGQVACLEQAPAIVEALMNGDLVDQGSHLQKRPAIGAGDSRQQGRGGQCFIQHFTL
jgi:hypothetical protein